MRTSSGTDGVVRSDDGLAQACAFGKEMTSTCGVLLSSRPEAPNDETLQAFREADQMFAAGAGRFTNAADLLADLDS